MEKGYRHRSRRLAVLHPRPRVADQRLHRGGNKASLLLEKVG